MRTEAIYKVKPSRLCSAYSSCLAKAVWPSQLQTTAAAIGQLGPQPPHTCVHFTSTPSLHAVHTAGWKPQTHVELPEQYKRTPVQQLYHSSLLVAANHNVEVSHTSTTDNPAALRCTGAPTAWAVLVLGAVQGLTPG